MSYVYVVPAVYLFCSNFIFEINISKSISKKLLIKFHCYLFICIFLFDRVLIGNTLAKEKEARCFYSHMKLCFFWSRLMSTNSYLHLIIKVITLVSLQIETHFHLFV